MELDSKHVREIPTIARIHQGLVTNIFRIWAFMVNPGGMETGGIYSGGTSTPTILDVVDV